MPFGIYQQDSHHVMNSTVLPEPVEGKVLVLTLCLAYVMHSFPVYWAAAARRISPESLQRLLLAIPRSPWHSSHYWTLWVVLLASRKGFRAPYTPKLLTGSASWRGTSGRTSYGQVVCPGIVGQGCAWCIWQGSFYPNLRPCLLKSYADWSSSRLL